MTAARTRHIVQRCSSSRPNQGTASPPMRDSPSPPLFASRRLRPRRLPIGRLTARAQLDHGDPWHPGMTAAPTAQSRNPKRHAAILIYLSVTVNHRVRVGVWSSVFANCHDSRAARSARSARARASASCAATRCSGSCVSRSSRLVSRSVPGLSSSFIGLPPSGRALSSPAGTPDTGSAAGSRARERWIAPRLNARTVRRSRDSRASRSGRPHGWRLVTDGLPGTGQVREHARHKKRHVTLSNVTSRSSPQCGQRSRFCRRSSRALLLSPTVHARQSGFNAEARRIEWTSC